MMLDSRHTSVSVFFICFHAKKHKDKFLLFSYLVAIETMKTLFSVAFLVLLFCSFLGTTDAFGVEPTRRDVLTAAAAAASFAVLPTSAAHAVLTACPPNSNNCIRTTWTAPDGINVAKSMQTILDSYPQEGQNKVDLGGWSVAEGDLTSTGKVRVEFKSGLGNFAKFLNGNKPFVDDLEIEIVKGSKTVELRSASRVGDSDLGVNQKRLQFLAAKAKEMGFETPAPKY